MNYIFEIFHNENSEILKDLYKVFIDISHENGLHIIENKQSYYYFLQMMYRNSTKEIVTY